MESWPVFNFPSVRASLLKRRCFTTAFYAGTSWPPPKHNIGWSSSNPSVQTNAMCSVLFTLCTVPRALNCHALKWSATRMLVLQIKKVGQKIMIYFSIAWDFILKINWKNLKRIKKNEIIKQQTKYFKSKHSSIINIKFKLLLKKYEKRIKHIKHKCSSGNRRSLGRQTHKYFPLKIK